MKKNGGDKSAVQMNSKTLMYVLCPEIDGA